VERASDPDEADRRPVGDEDAGAVDFLS
jgi:hypothetical protein